MEVWSITFGSIRDPIKLLLETYFYGDEIRNNQAYILHRIILYRPSHGLHVLFCIICSYKWFLTVLQRFYLFNYYIRSEMVT